MAQQAIAAPGHRYFAPNCGEVSEHGENYYDLLTKIQANFTELYTLVSGISAAELGFVDGVTAGTAAVSKALVLDANLGITAFREAGRNARLQAAPVAMTVTATIAVASILGGLITANQGAAGAATYTMPQGSVFETAFVAAFPGLQNNDSIDFTIVNISTVAAEDVTVAGDTGMTAVGNMTIASNAAVADQAWGTFRVRRTAQNAYSFYRIG